MVRRIIFLATLTVAVVAIMAAAAVPAFAYSDYVKYLSKGVTGPGSSASGLADGTTYGAYALGCFWCHGWDKMSGPNTTNQVDVTKVTTGGSYLGSVNPTNTTNVYQQYNQAFGPHGGYTNTTDRCKVCHDVHAAAGDKRLLPGNTVAEICETCHDFTEGISIYGAIKAQTGTAPAGGHQIYGLNSSEGSATATTGQYIPGGDFGNGGSFGPVDTIFPNTGGTVAYSSVGLASQEDHLTCTDCHTPHGNTSMQPFKNDRVRLGSGILIAACNVQPDNINETEFSLTLLPGTGHETHLPAGTPITTSMALAPDSPAYIAGHQTSIKASGVALALSLLAAGVLDISVETTTDAAYAGTLALAGTPTTYVLLRDAHLTRTASNKLLRDFIGGTGTGSAIDLRDAKFGGQAPTSYTTATYDPTADQQDYVLNAVGDVLNGTNTGGTQQAGSPWVNGQNGAKAVYGSSFCYGCHRGRLGNMYGGAGGIELDPDFHSMDASSAYNHPTNMKLAYSAVGGLTSFAAASPSPGVSTPWLNASGSVDNIPDELSTTGVHIRNGFPMAVTTGLALSNQGYVMEPVEAGHADGSISRGDPSIHNGTSGPSDAAGAAIQAGEDAPICQQCHEDSRDLTTNFTVGDTDKDVGFADPVNHVLGMGHDDGVTPTLINAGNPMFANFPHETQNARMLVEGGDSNKAGGGQNDNLCLNCHIPGSTVRFGDTDPSHRVTGADGHQYYPQVVSGVNAAGAASTSKVGDGFQE